MIGAERQFVMADEAVEQLQEGVEQHNGMEMDSDVAEILYFDSSSSSSDSGSGSDIDSQINILYYN